MLIGRSPPLAEVPAEIRIDPKGATPTEFIVVAPVGFNFTEDCLVSPGDNNEIESCEVMFPNVAGYAAARIKTRPGGLSRPTEYVVVDSAAPEKLGALVTRSFEVLLSKPFFCACVRATLSWRFCSTTHPDKS